MRGRTALPDRHHLHELYAVHAHHGVCRHAHLLRERAADCLLTQTHGAVLRARGGCSFAVPSHNPVPPCSIGVVSMHVGVYGSRFDRWSSW